MISACFELFFLHGLVDHHRRLRNRLIRESALDEIPGIGPAKKGALLTRFEEVRFTHVDRGANAEADRLANLAIDRALARESRR